MERYCIHLAAKGEFTMVQIDLTDEQIKFLKYLEECVNSSCTSDLQPRLWIFKKTKHWDVLEIKEYDSYDVFCSESLNA